MILSYLNGPLTILSYRIGMVDAFANSARRGIVAFLSRVFVCLLCAMLATPVFAQSVVSNSNTTTGTVNGSTTCTAPLVRNISVTDSFTIADVTIGILVTHTWRGDLQFTLQSPTGTRVQLTNGDTANINGDNFNVLLDDSAAQLVNTDGATTNHLTTAPPFQNTFRPRNPLSAFDGQNSAGTWRLEICDLFPSADNGTFRRATLNLTSTPTNYADLSLAKVLVGSPPISGGTAVYRLTIANSATSPQTATGISVEDTFPSGFTFSSASGSGSFNSTTRIWTVPDLAPGATASIEIRGSISSAAGTTVTNTAEIISSSVADLDSTPNNGVTTEDDYAAASFVVQTGRAPGVPPFLSCPAGYSAFDWDTITGWVDGTTDNSFAFGTFGNVRFQLTNDGAYVNSATFGGQNPTVFNYFTGGLPSAENSLTVVSNQTNQSGEVTLTITLPRSFTGIQFSIFDVDFGSGQFADRVAVSGLNGATVVTPTLTNGNANYVSGGEVIGDGSSGPNEALGNVVVTFAQTVDTIVIRYGNHSTAPADPGQQGIGIHDISYCMPFTTLNVTKVSSIVSDPVNGATNPKAIPGALIEYLITVSNSGSDAADSDSIVLTDDAPADAKMCLVSFSGGTGPIVFNAGSPSSGLSYSYSSLNNALDDLEFSSDNGTTWTYAPTADGDGCDTAVTDFRVNPSGTFAASTSFTVRVRFIVE